MAAPTWRPGRAKTFLHFQSPINALEDVQLPASIRMSLSKWLLIGFLVLPLAELAVFVAVALQIGLLPGLALMAATSVLGVGLLRLAGQGQRIPHIRVSTIDGDVAAAASPGFFLAVSGILLVLPGFLTDALGLLMLLPPVRRTVGAALGRFFRPPSRARDDVVDLEPAEWAEDHAGRPPPDELPKP